MATTTLPTTGADATTVQPEPVSGATPETPTGTEYTALTVTDFGGDFNQDTSWTPHHCTITADAGDATLLTLTYNLNVDARAFARGTHAGWYLTFPSFALGTKEVYWIEIVESFTPDTTQPLGFVGIAVGPTTVDIAVNGCIAGMVFEGTTGAEYLTADNDDNCYNGATTAISEPFTAGTIKWLKLEFTRTRWSDVVINATAFDGDGVAISSKGVGSKYNYIPPAGVMLLAGLADPDYTAETATMKIRIYHGTEAAEELPA